MAKIFVKVFNLRDYNSRKIIWCWCSNTNVTNGKLDIIKPFQSLFSVLLKQQKVSVVCCRVSK